MHYTPILKDKAAELKSLTLLSSPTPISLADLWPLIDVLPETEADIKADLEAISRSATASPCARFMVDLNDVYAAFPGATFTHGPSTYTPLNFLGVIAIGNWALTPVVTMSSTADLRRDAVAEAARHSAGLAIRLFFEDLDDAGFPASLETLVTSLGLPKSQLHLLIDAAAVPQGSVAALSMALIGTLSSLPGVGDWASITIAGSGFPATSPQDPAGAGSIARIPRTEWQLFNRLLKRFPDLDLSFGDYVVDHPEFAPNPNARAVSNLRYTTTDEWMFVKGKLVTRGGAPYFRDVCRILSAEPEYMRPPFSWGDEFIDVCGGGGGGTGNATIWRQVAITHHITFVLDQMSRLGAGATATTPAF